MPNCPLTLPRRTPERRRGAPHRAASPPPAAGCDRRRCRRPSPRRRRAQPPLVVWGWTRVTGASICRGGDGRLDLAAGRAAPLTGVEVEVRIGGARRAAVVGLGWCGFAPAACPSPVRGVTAGSDGGSTLRCRSSRTAGLGPRLLGEVDSAGCRRVARGLLAWLQ